MTHVFIVDDITFKYHLEYMFAGTGAGDKVSVFLRNSEYKNTRTNNSGQITSSSESGLVSMIADISKIKTGDRIVFYLQATSNHQGMFFGFFRASGPVFFDEADEDNYLYNLTNKYLTYRVKITPECVFEQGVTEHEFLDSLQNKKHPSDLCWSLIYRKLKGNRGCTTIFDYEADDLINKIMIKNNKNTLISKGYSYSSSLHKIIPTEGAKPYIGRMFSINIADRLKYKSENKKAYESHLQAYITQNVHMPHLKDLILPVPDLNLYWIGNEVSCGVGMQRIDLLVIQETNEVVYIKVIELKDEEPQEYIVNYQLQWYIEWLNYYVLPHYKNKLVKLIPCVIANGIPSKEFYNVAQCAKFVVDCESVEYIGFDIKTQTFKKYF